MGVTKLWDILQEVKDDVTLEEIRGLTLAVDLATWICESEGVKPMKSYVTKPYLRNLFFRVSGVLKARINLVFVLDGTAPEVKLETIARRLAASSGSPKKTSSGIRRRLNAKLKECCILLDSLGVPWIKAESEAEALCAALDKTGLVDGVITNDGDAFLYGARTVYRNFSVEKNAIIEKCCMDSVESKLNLNQRDLIALGLLLGCDYCPKGVPGIGVAQAVKLLASFGDHDALNVFKAWKETGELVNNFSNSKRTTHCSTCTHEGTKREHSNHGCDSCGYACSESTSDSRKTLQSIPCKCPWHVHEEKRKKHILEEKIKSAALKDSNFPDEAIIKEFLKKQRYVCSTKANAVDPSTDETLRARFKIKSPTLDIACEYLKYKLGWEISYALTKVLPLVTHHLLNNWNIKVEQKSAQVSLDSILKTRVKDQVKSLEVRWILLGNLTVQAADEELVTIEPEEDMKKAFPNHVTGFYERIQREKDEKKKAKVEARKAERKKLKDSVKKPEPVQTMKMTDFFKARKQKHVVKNSQKSDGPPKVESRQSFDVTDSHGQTDLTELELSMKSLSISKSGPKTRHNKQSVVDKTKISQQVPLKATNCDKVLDRGTSSLRDAKILKVPVIIFSSDSDSEDNDLDARLDAGKLLKSGSNSGIAVCGESPKTGCYSNEPCISANACPDRTQDCLAQEITFSNDLNFSLGCSLMHTTVAEEQKENNSPQHNDDVGNTINHKSIPSGTNNTSPKQSLSESDSNRVRCKNLSEILICDTPIKTVASPLESKVSDSPVFMTLMERLKHRQKK